MLSKSKSLYSEKRADKMVIGSLLKTIRQLTGVDMSKIIKSIDGKVYVVHDYEEVTAEDAAALLDQFKAETPLLEEIVASNVVPEAPAQPETPAAPADSTPAQPEQPATGNENAPAEPAPAPADQAAPSVPEQQADPAANADPAATAPSQPAEAGAQDGQTEPAPTLQ